MEYAAGMARHVRKAGSRRTVRRGVHHHDARVSSSVASGQTPPGVRRPASTTTAGDHGNLAAGAWRAKSEMAAPGPVSPPSPTFHGDGGRRPGQTGREMPRQREKWPRDPTGQARTPHDHGSAAGGAWRNKSETLPGTVIMRSVLLGRHQTHDHDGDERARRHDHGSGAPGTAKSP